MLRWAAQISPEPTSQVTDSMYSRMNAVVFSILNNQRVTGEHPRGDIPGFLPPPRGGGRGRGRGHTSGHESQRGRGRGVRGRGI